MDGFWPGGGLREDGLYKDEIHAYFNITNNQQQAEEDSPSSHSLESHSVNPEAQSGWHFKMKWIVVVLFVALAAVNAQRPVSFNSITIDFFF